MCVYSLLYPATTGFVEPQERGMKLRTTSCRIKVCLDCTFKLLSSLLNGNGSQQGNLGSVALYRRILNTFNNSWDPFGEKPGQLQFKYIAKTGLRFPTQKYKGGNCANSL